MDHWVDGGGKYRGTLKRWTRRALKCTKKEFLVLGCEMERTENLKGDTESSISSFN